MPAFFFFYHEREGFINPTVSFLQYLATPCVNSRLTGYMLCVFHAQLCVFHAERFCFFSRERFEPTTCFICVESQSHEGLNLPHGATGVFLCGRVEEAMQTCVALQYAYGHFTTTLSCMGKCCLYLVVYVGVEHTDRQVGEITWMAGVTAPGGERTPASWGVWRD